MPLLKCFAERKLSFLLIQLDLEYIGFWDLRFCGQLWILHHARNRIKHGRHASVLIPKLLTELTGNIITVSGGAASRVSYISGTHTAASIHPQDRSVREV